MLQLKVYPIDKRDTAVKAKLSYKLEAERKSITQLGSSLLTIVFSEHV